MGAGKRSEGTTKFKDSNVCFIIFVRWSFDRYNSYQMTIESNYAIAIAKLGDWPKISGAKQESCIIYQMTDDLFMEGSWKDPTFRVVVV